MSYWDAYDLPVPIRNYWIQRYNKHQTKKSDEPDANQPLSRAERMKFIRDAQKVSNQPERPPELSSLMAPRRNQK